MLDVEIDRFGYRRGQSQLNNVRLRLDLGRTVLLGPNGAGKSTLLRAIAGVHPFRGKLRLDGTDVRPGARDRPVEYRTAVGWLPQDVRPFAALTAREHVAYLGWLKGLSTKDAWSRAEDALEAVGLGSRAGHKANQLSGGQTRRLGIAGVLVHDARYLLLDEPTAGLDPREQDRLLEVLTSLEQSHAILVSTHDAGSLIDPTSRVMVLADGGVRFSGSYEEFAAAAPNAGDGTVRRAYAAWVTED